MKSRVVFKSTHVEWATPRGVYEALDAEFHFDFDPCPLGGSNDALAPLFTEWCGKRVFCNPPYGDVSKWLQRGREADLAVFLIPARTDTKWFHNLILPFADEIRFIRGRLRFGEATAPAPFPSMIVVFSPSTSAGLAKSGSQEGTVQELANPTPGALEAD